MGLIPALLLAAADTSAGTGTLPAPAAEQRFAVTLGLGADAEPQYYGQFGFVNVSLRGDLELSFKILRSVRIALISGGGWSPEFRPGFPGQHGLFRALAAFDFLVAFRGGELFFGAGAGVEHTNLLGDEDWTGSPTYLTSFFTGPAVLARVGTAFRISERLMLGANFGYSVFYAVSTFRQSMELTARFSFLF